MNNKMNIELILNTPDDKMADFRELFIGLEKQGAGKLNKTHFCINSSLQLQPRNQNEVTFNNILRGSFNAGKELVCFCTSIKAENSNNIVKTEEYESEIK